MVEKHRRGNNKIRRERMAEIGQDSEDLDGLQKTTLKISATFFKIQQL